MVGQEAQVRQLNGAIQSSEAQVASARLNLNYARIVAPIDGRLGLRQVDAGNMVRSGDQNGIVVITQMRPISVIFTVPETELPPVLEAMRADRRLSVEAWDRADAVKLATGALQTVDNQIDTATGTIKLRATFENADESLFPNQFVNIRLRVRTLQNATTIPAAAVQRAAFGEFVYVVKPGPEPTVSIQRVTLGPTEGERVAVTNGLAPQAQVVLEGVDQLTEGAKVEIVPEGGAPAGPPTGRRRGPGGQGARSGRPRSRRPGRAGRRSARRAPGAAPSQGAPAPGAGPGRRGRAPGRPGRRHGSGRRAAAALMNLSRPFILRPVATALLMAALLLSGILAYRLLPVSALPQVDYPTIRIITFYPGASPEVMTSSVTAPLERQFGQLPGLAQMSSTSSGGASVITLRFELAKPLSVAEQEVQAAMNAANSLLPNDLPQPPVYNKVNPADTPVLTLAVTSGTVPLPQIYDLIDTRVAQKLSQLPGVGLVSIAGGQRPAVRIQANPQALASNGLNLQNIRAVISAANVNQPKGSFDGPQRSFTLDANDQLRSPEAYKDLIVAYREGAPIRLRDVADIVDGAENRRLSAWANELPAVLINVQRQPGANVIEVVDRIQELLPQLTASLPSTLQVAVLSDRTETIRASVEDVQHELIFAIGLVVLVTFLFLRNVPATIIPSIVVPLSLVGTFGVMYLAGFSINNLTLMALTIATGFVVDDAIVMVENIARHIEMGETPFQAALKGAEEIGFTLVSLTVSLIAVLIPLLFMADVVGRLFREFAITLAVSILISLVVSLTLTPMMAARLLKHAARLRAGLVLPASPAPSSTAIVAWYGRLLRVVLNHQPADAAGRRRDAGADGGALHRRCRRASSRCRTPARSR